MNHQGAGFAFDANMDFSNMFAATPDTLFKPADNTSDFFFADEGIDTATSSFVDPITLSTPQQAAFDMDLQHSANYFPPTPAAQFLDTIPTQFNAFGKRPLQLEADDFPQSKRQAGYDFPLFPTPPATTASSWGLEPTTTTTTAEGLSDEAADVCATWFTKYNVLPGDRHIDSLSQLTGESADAIRSWFGQLLKQGMGKGGPSDSAYKSQTAHIQQQDSFWDDHTYQTELLRASPPQPLQILAEDAAPAVSFDQENTVSATAQPAATARSCKKRCTPTDDLALLSRDPRKIYQCTRKCGKRYGRKNDWKRKEEEGYPCKSWVCSLCISEGVENVKPCYRKYHFVQHFRNIHADVDPEAHEEASIVYSETEFPRKCGFCRHRFASRQERIDHIADHFKQGKCMLDWRDDDENNDHGDSTDDDNDDRPSGNGSDGRSSSQPPPFHPRGGNDSNSFGGHGSSGGSGEQPPQGGFFHFQLSQLGESQRYCAAQPTRPTTPSPNISQSSISPECADMFPADESFQPQGPPDRNKPTEGEHEITLAGDAIAQLVAMKTEALVHELSDVHGLEDTNATNASVRSETEVMRLISQPSLSQPEAIMDGLPIREQDIGIPRLSPAIAPAIRSQCSDAIDQAPSLPSMPQNPISRAFHSIKLLGAGGFSTVDEVRHQQTGLRVVRKTLKNRNQTALDELKKEVNVLQKLRHPHIIRFLGAYSKGDKMSILIAPIADTTLAVWLDQSASQQPARLFETIVKMFGCLASSVRYLHEQRPMIKHMDIKPQNILVVEGDREFPHVVLCDFGVSSAEEESDNQSRPWTRQYVAPEVFDGFTRKQAADIWSLGCVFAEMASIALSPENAGWLAFNKAFSGRTGTYYWQDVPGVQKKLSAVLEGAKTSTEQVVVRTIQAMLSAQPDERPDASSLTKTFTPAPCCLNWPNDKMVFPGPHEELHEVEKFGKQHCMESHSPPRTHEEHATDGAVGISVAKTWLEDCLCTHSGCHHSSPVCAGDLPKRLIDILPEGQPGSYVRIVKSDTLETASQDVQYVALSHVWSHAEPVLSSGSLSRMQAELGLEALPVAVRNAISAIQHLGFRYCWLDSLCILQDSDQEKEQECTQMSSVFRNAVLTVVLDQLADAGATRGVEQETEMSAMTSNTPLISPMTSTPAKSTIATRLPASALLPADVLAAPNLGWDTRAWALQDRLLSRRFLHLGQQSYWECNTLKASETFPQGLPALLWEKTHTQCDDDHVSVPEASCYMRPGKTFTLGRCNDTSHSLTTTASAPQANKHAPSRLPSPHPPLPSASRLRNCQWIKKQGDDVGQGTEAVQATLDIYTPQGPMAYADPGCCTRYSRGNSSRTPEQAHQQPTCGNASANETVLDRPIMIGSVSGLGYKGSGARSHGAV